VAVHILSLLAYQTRALTSDHIAGSVNTNPVVIRRLLGLLRRAGLVKSAEGAGGGSALARPAGQITLAEVLAAVEGKAELFDAPRNGPNVLCPVGRCVQRVLRKRVKPVERAMRREMKKTTVADVLADIRSAGRR
jgi:Rrf2 family protein